MNRRLYPGIMAIILMGLIMVLYSRAGAGETAEPVIKKKLLPCEKWEREYKEYFKRHYHDDSLDLVPKAIVMHYTASNSFSSAWNTFYNGANYDDGDVGVIFGHLSVHFIIDRDGTIYQTLPLNRRCRGAYGVNNVALSIEMVGASENSVLSDKNLMDSSFRLVAWLMDKYNIPLQKVYGHYEVAAGKKYVPEYVDYGDSRSPDSYPPAFGRSDPGHTYMKKLRDYLKSLKK